MVWGLVRIAVISTAFLVGLLIGPLGVTGHSDSGALRHLSERIGTSLVVRCESGNVVVKHAKGELGAIQLECAQGKILLVREQRDRKASYYHLLGM